MRLSETINCMRSTFVIIFILGCSLIGHAQSVKHKIRVLAKVNNNGILLRWAPADAVVWQLGNQYGYKIERYTLNDHGDLDSKDPMNLHTAPIKPLSEQALSALSTTTPDASVIQELIYETETRNTAERSENPAQLLKNNEDLNNRFGMALLICDLSPALAKAAGLFFADTTTVKNGRYIYKISVAHGDLKMQTESGVIVVDFHEPKPLQPFNDLEATFGDRTMTLSWPTFTHTGIYTAYHIEKSIDGKTFNALTDLPYMPMSESIAATDGHFVDSLENNSQVYHYRVVGITPFGEKGPPSNIVSGNGKDDMAGVLILREVRRNDKNKVEIQWEFPAGFDDKISGFVIEKALKAEGPYRDINKKIINKKSRISVDESSSASAYYKIKAIDIKGAELSHSHPYFFHVEDNIPPAIPVELSGKINNKGIASLSWKHNGDADLLGYRVFASNDLNHEFVEVTHNILPAASYNDTVNIRVLNKKIYYKVVAVDNNFNTSNYSVALTLHKPDIIPPAPPVFGKIEKLKSSISLQWTNSASNDAASYVLSRTIENDSVKTKVAQWRADKPRNKFEDETVTAGKSYRYVLSVYDSTGNVSTTHSKSIQFNSAPPKALSDMTATIERDKKLITLTWKYDQAPKKCLLYRRKNNEPFSLYQTLDGSINKFADDQVMINNTYSYKIQLVLDQKAKTQLSKELKVPF